MPPLETPPKGPPNWHGPLIADGYENVAGTGEDKLAPAPYHGTTAGRAAWEATAIEGGRYLDTDTDTEYVMTANGVVDVGPAAAISAHKYLMPVNVQDYGWDPTMATTVTVAQVNAVGAAALGTAYALDPATNVRVAQRSVNYGRGRYLFDAAAAAAWAGWHRSVSGLHEFGEGVDICRIYFTGTYAGALLDLNGWAYSSISDLSLHGVSGMECQHAIRWWWDDVGASPTKAARSTTLNRFQNVQVHSSVKCVTAFRGGDGTATNQVDQTTLIRCEAGGSNNRTDATWWQNGFWFGAGPGNNLIHNTYDCTSNNFKHGVKWLHTNGSWLGGNLQNNQVDVRVEGSTTGHVAVRGVRSEDSVQLLTASGGTVPVNITISDTLFLASELDPVNNRLIDVATGGRVALEGVQVRGHTAGIVPKLRCSPASPLVLYADVNAECDLWQMMTHTGGVTVVSSGSATMNTSGAVTATRGPVLEGAVVSGRQVDLTTSTAATSGVVPIDPRVADTFRITVDSAVSIRPVHAGAIFAPITGWPTSSVAATPLVARRITVKLVWTGTGSVTWDAGRIRQPSGGVAPASTVAGQCSYFDLISTEEGKYRIVKLWEGTDA